MLADKILKLAQEEHIPVLGFGPVSEMAGERPGHWPEDLLPGSQSLICFGLPVPQGVYRTPSCTLETVWRSQSANCRRLDTLSMRIAALLADNGARAVPIYGCQPMGVNNRGQVVGCLNQIQMGTWLWSGPPLVRQLLSSSPGTGELVSLSALWCLAIGCWTLSHFQATAK